MGQFGNRGLSSSWVRSPLPSSVLLSVPFTLQGWVSCSIPSTRTGELLPAASSHKGLLNAQLADTEQGCGPRDRLWWEQRQNQQWNLQVSLSLLALFLPRASLFSSLEIQMVPGVSSLFFFLHGYFYPFVFRSLGLWVPVAAASARGYSRREGWEEIRPQ